jgi:hypothetical protein
VRPDKPSTAGYHDQARLRLPNFAHNALIHLMQTCFIFQVSSP